jgi:hypothetical protein
MNDVDPQAGLTDVRPRRRLSGSPLDELLPWNWTPLASALSAQAA